MTEPTCGQELAASAVVPEKIGELMRHVAQNLRAHAAWVGDETPAAEAEQTAMSSVADCYQGIADAAARAAVTMLGCSSLGPAPHDPMRFDRPAFALWMREKIRLQRELAALLVHHAEMSERGLAETPS
jgi:hypothetical protein